MEKLFSETIQSQFLPNLAGIVLGLYLF